MSIQVKGLLKVFGTQKAVNEISFDIKRGEIVGFLGPNGAGKSTTMKMITGYLLPDAGSIEVSGIDVLKNQMEAKKKIGYLPEANPLYFDMYVKEYLHFIASIHHLPQKQKAIQQVIERVGLTLESSKKIGQLSKGYKQRVGLAAALIHDPEVLILDEPTSGLDPNQIIEIRNVISDLARTKTVLFSSHIMQEVEALCQRAIIINRGNIVADDLLENLQQAEFGTPVVIVKFNQAVDIASLQQLQDVIKVEQTGTGTYQLETVNPDNTRKALLQYSIDHQINIDSLQSKRNNLEAVFKSYTT